MPPERVSASLLTTKEQRSSVATAGDKPPTSPKLVPNKPDVSLVWHGVEYPTVEPGIYIARGMSVQGPQWVRSYMRWSLRVEFGLIHEPISVSAFFNFGNDPNRAKVARQGRFFKAWTLANGELPRKGQPMRPDVFLDGQFFEVEVADCSRDAEGNPKPNAEAYSRITRIISMTRP